MKRVFCSLILLSASLVSCDRDDAKEQVATTEAPEQPAASAAVPSMPADSELRAIPVPEDFEDEAETNITAQNLEDELDKLEKEILEDN